MTWNKVLWKALGQLGHLQLHGQSPFFSRRASREVQQRIQVAAPHPLLSPGGLLPQALAGRGLGSGQAVLLRGGLRPSPAAAALPLDLHPSSGVRRRCRRLCGGQAGGEPLRQVVAAAENVLKKIEALS